MVAATTAESRLGRIGFPSARERFDGGSAQERGWVLQNGGQNGPGAERYVVALVTPSAFRFGRNLPFERGEA